MKENNIVLSTRIRLARNLKNYPFVSKLDNNNGLKIIEEIKSTVLSSNEKSPAMFREVDKSELKKEGGKLIEAHLISPAILNSSVPSSVIIDKNKEISIMINEEDHLRIQVIKDGYNLKDAFYLANACDDLIEEKNEYAFSEKYGYLTSCPTNVGTGLRASVMLHIPALVMTGRINELIGSVNRLGIAVRGYYGEGSQALGNIFQISNQVTLGISESEISEKLENVANQIIEQENELRQKLPENEIKDKVMRSMGILKYCYLINYREFTNLWSNVMLGIDMGIIDNIDKNKFKNLLSELAPNSLECDNPEERDKKRAEILRGVI